MKVSNAEKLPGIMKLPPFKQDDFLANARRTNAEKLSNAMKKISETDLCDKTSKATPRLVNRNARLRTNSHKLAIRN